MIDQCKGDLLTHILSEAPADQALVFCKTKRADRTASGITWSAPADFKAGRVRAGRAVSLVSAGDRHLLRDIQRLPPSPIEQVAIEGYAVSATSHAALPEDDRRSHSGRHRRGGPVEGRPGAHRRPGGFGRRPSRPSRGPSARG